MSNIFFSVVLWCSQWKEEDEIADYERNCEWMDECLDGMFEKWFDKIGQASVEDKRKVHTSLSKTIYPAVFTIIINGFTIKTISEMNTKGQALYCRENLRKLKKKIVNGTGWRWNLTINACSVYWKCIFLETSGLDHQDLIQYLSSANTCKCQQHSHKCLIITQKVTRANIWHKFVLKHLPGSTSGWSSLSAFI